MNNLVLIDYLILFNLVGFFCIVILVYNLIEDNIWNMMLIGIKMIFFLGIENLKKWVFKFGI